MSVQPEYQLRWELFDPESQRPHCSDRTIVVEHTETKDSKILDLDFLSASTQPAGLMGGSRDWMGIRENTGKPAVGACCGSQKNPSIDVSCRYRPSMPENAGRSDYHGMRTPIIIVILLLAGCGGSTSSIQSSAEDIEVQHRARARFLQIKKAASAREPPSIQDCSVCGKQLEFTSDGK